MKQQLRKLKLYELGIAEWPYETSYEKMKEVVDQNLDGFEIKTTEKWSNSYFFMQGDRFVMEQDQKNGHLWVRQDGFWSIFSNDFSLEYRDIQAIIKFLVEQHLKSKVGRPVDSCFRSTSPVEQHLKSKVVTPVGPPLVKMDKVEQHLKSKVGTPEIGDTIADIEVEQHLKSKVEHLLNHKSIKVTPIKNDSSITTDK